MQDLNDNIFYYIKILALVQQLWIQLKIKYSSIAKDAIKLKMKQETLSEEQRILYVALTRAKRKAIYYRKK